MNEIFFCETGSQINYVLFTANHRFNRSAVFSSILLSWPKSFEIDRPPQQSIIRNNFIRIIMITPPVSDTPNKSYIFPSSKRKTTVLHDFLQIEPWGLRETCPKSSQGCYPSVLSRKWGGKYPLTPPYPRWFWIRPQPQTICQLLFRMLIFWVELWWIQQIMIPVLTISLILW